MANLRQILAIKSFRISHQLLRDPVRELERLDHLGLKDRPWPAKAREETLRIGKVTGES